MDAEAIISMSERHTMQHIV